MFKRSFAILLIVLTNACNNEPDAPLPTANFYVDNAACNSGCYVYFYDQSSHAVAWEWDFGNGIFSTYQNDSVFYNDPGLYEVTLTVWNADQIEDAVSKTITIN
ncbi:MAG: PKD domain-containing protein [Crocinitomicaceae bacterium]